MNHNVSKESLKILPSPTYCNTTTGQPLKNLFTDDKNHWQRSQGGLTKITSKTLKNCAFACEHKSNNELDQRNCNYHINYNPDRQLLSPSSYLFFLIFDFEVRSRGEILLSPTLSSCTHVKTH